MLRHHRISKNQNLIQNNSFFENRLFLDWTHKWKLVNVKTDTEFLFPKVNFFLTVEKNLEDDISNRQGEYLLKFNLDRNKCWCYPDITPDKIIYESAACTKICCDGIFDTIGGFLNYNGNYKIVDDTLTIINDNVYTLIKVAE